MIIIITTFGNQIFLELNMINVCKKLDKQRVRVVCTKYWKFLCIFYCFSMRQNLESAMGDLEMKCNAKLGCNKFSVNVSVLLYFADNKKYRNYDFCNIYFKWCLPRDKMELIPQLNLIYGANERCKWDSITTVCFS